MPIKILYVITKSNWGGAQRYVYDLAISAQEAGYEAVVAVGEAGPLAEKLRAAGIRTLSLPFRQRRTFIGDLVTFSALFSLIALFRAERPHIVHVNSAKAGGLGALAARITRIPYIVFTAHGWEFNAPRSWLSKAGIRLFSWLTILLAHRTIAVSESIRTNVRHWPGARKRITVIHNGIVCGASLTKEQARAMLAPHTIGKYWIGMVSELTPTKRVEDALSALPAVVAAHPEVILVVIGEGKERPLLEDRIRDLHLGHHVSLVGFKDNAASLLRAFDLFVHTSGAEALGYAILEAGCAELPVIATRIGGIPEIISDADHGSLIPIGDTAALISAIEAFIRDPQLAHEIAGRLHARVQTAFSKTRMIRETFALYKR
jgi:glycosyltransferase involved in cell wall biosynthesis